MKNLLPVFILNRFSEKLYHGELECYTVFIDMSGFTRMSQELMNYDKEGSELLCMIINKVFSSAIASVHNNGGFISTFAGDAFTAIFAKKDTCLGRVVQTCRDINDRIGKLSPVETRLGNFAISVKMGVSEGMVKWGILKTDKDYSFFFRGDGIDKAAHAEHQAQKNNIIIDNRLKRDLIKIDSNILCSPAGDLHFRLDRFKSPKAEKIPVIKSDMSLARHFVPESVRNLKVKGEFRDMISLFLTFKEEGAFIDGITEAINQSKKYGAYLKQIDFGDKGGTLLFFFGAPVAMEKMHERAVDFALKCLQIKDLNCRMGITFGRAFAGLIGSEARSEYGALGNVVNKSARLTMATEWGCISVDEAVYNKIMANYDAELAGSKNFKGFDGKINYYRILKKKIRYKNAEYKGRMFARDRELNFLTHRINSLRDGKFCGIVYIHGDPGIGKTRLIWELKKNIDEDIFEWAYMPCDPILGNSFNPVKYFLRDFFNYSDDRENEGNKEAFEEGLATILDMISDNYLKSELDRTRSVLGSIMGIDYGESLYSQISSKNRRDNIIHSLKNLLKSICLIKPLVIELDDGQWIDPDTMDLVQTLTVNTQDFPILILSGCRYRDNGERFSFGLEKIKQHTDHIDLKYFEKDTIKSFIQDFFNISYLPEETLGYIVKYSSGNPFFLEQILSFIRENNLLDAKGKIISKDIQIPSDINSLIIARIDRLSSDLREIIKTASVLGVEFPVKLLQNMLSGKPIDDKLKRVENEQIWIPFTQLSYMFRHVLIRESVYQIQLKETLVKLHNSAAKAIQALYRDKIEAHYPELANHYEMAEEIDDARKYLKLSINIFKKEYQIQKALDYCSRLLRYTLDEKERLKIRITTMFFLNELGRLDESLELGHNILKKAVEMAYHDMVLTANHSLGNVYNLIYDLDNAEKHFNYILNNAEEIQDKAILASTYKSLGLNWHHRGYDDRALVNFQKALDIYLEIDDKNGIAISYNDIAIFCGRQIGLEKVLDYLFKAYEIHREFGNIIDQIRPLSNIGLTYYEVYLDLEKSNIYYQRAIEIAEKTGSYRNLMILYLNMSLNYSQMGNTDKALEYIEKSMHYSNEMGDTDNLSLGYIGLGDICFIKGNFEKALEYINRAIELTEGKNMDLRLIDHKSSKITALIELGRYHEAFEEFKDVKRMSCRYKIKSLTELIKISEYKIKHLLGYKTALGKLLRIANSGLCMQNEALSFYLLWVFTKKEKYRVKALAVYKQLIEDQAEDYKNYGYIERAKELEAQKPAQ